MFPRATTQFTSLLFDCAALVVVNWKCRYLLRITTHLEHRVLTDAPCVLTKFMIMSLFSRITTYFASWLFNCIAIMDPRCCCVAAGAYLARYVCSVVRDSRMWCPHGIGRDSWVWGEQGTLEMMNSPHELGDEALIERRPLSGGNGVALG